MTPTAVRPMTDPERLIYASVPWFVRDPPSPVVQRISAMKKVSALVVTALIPLFAATMAQSCAGGESVESVGGGSGGDTGSGGGNGDGSGGNGSGGKVGSGGSS